jgi:hypothetical protein
LRRYFADLAGRVADLDVIEVAGRGQSYRQFAELLRRLSLRHDIEVEVRTRRVSRRPTTPQLAARLREMVGEELPRRTPRWSRRSETPPTTASARPTRSGDNVPGNRKRHPLAERREIELEVEAMLADDAIAL